MLVLNEDQRMLMDSARGAIAAKAPIAMWRQLRAEASPDGFSRAFWRECAEMGWTGVLVPQEFGGIDFGVDRRRPDRARDGAHARALAVPVDRSARRQRAATRRVRRRQRPSGCRASPAGKRSSRFAIDEGPHPSDHDAGDGGESRRRLAGHGRQAFRARRPCGGRLSRRIAKIRGWARAVSRRGRRARADARRAHAGRQQARRQRRARAGAIAAGRRARRRPD